SSPIACANSRTIEYRNGHYGVASTNTRCRSEQRIWIVGATGNCDGWSGDRKSVLPLWCGPCCICVNQAFCTRKAPRGLYIRQPRRLRQLKSNGDERKRLRSWGSTFSSEHW